MTSPSTNTGLATCVCVYHLSVVSIPKALHIEQCKCIQTLSCLIKYSFFAKIIIIIIIVVVVALAPRIHDGDATSKFNNQAVNK